MKKASFHFTPELHIFLIPARRQSIFEYVFDGPQSAKHLIEAAGVPHTEVSQIWVNGAPASFATQVQDGDQVEVFSFLTNLDNLSLRASGIRERSNPAWQTDDFSLGTSDSGERSNPLFILDNHLGKLASYLRMLGFDCLYRNTFQDDELAQLSQEQNRILLTRDHRLLMRKTITQGYWLRSQDPNQQINEVVNRYALAGLIRPFQRCMRCNGVLEPVSKETILHRLQPLTIKYFDEFRLCLACGQIYWQGSHYTKMLAFIQQITQDHPSPDGRWVGDEGISHPT
jgi:uncharacterized protein